jgi:hypothetical protein
MTQASLDIQLLLDANDKPFGGFFRDYFSPGSVAFFGFSGDPTIHTLDWGEFPTFELATHVGAFSACSAFADMGVLTDQYLATKQ